MHSTRPAQPVETQDGFFCCLAGWSVLTGLAIVHWIGCINATKVYVYTTILVYKSTGMEIRPSSSLNL